MKYVYYPGCSQEVTAKNYDVSAKAIAKTLGLEMEEMAETGARSPRTCEVSVMDGFL